MKQEIDWLRLSNVETASGIEVLYAAKLFSKNRALHKIILKHALDEITKQSVNALPDMNQEPDDYLKTISEVLRDPREDRKIISKIAKEIYLQ